MLSILSIPYPRALFLAKRMDIREVRRQNLIALRSEKGSVRALADLIDTDPNYLSQILGGKGRHFMGHTLARRLESALKKPKGWMDQPHDLQDQEEYEINDIARLVRMLVPAQRESLKTFISTLIQSPSPRSSPTPAQPAQPDQERRTG